MKNLLNSVGLTTVAEMRAQIKSQAEGFEARLEDYRRKLAAAATLLGDNIVEKLTKLKGEHRTLITSADEARTLAYSLLDFAEDADAKALQIGEIIDAGEELLEMQTPIGTVEMTPAVAAALGRNQDES